jgi:fumarylacetoacetate (FAA) hydrolase
MDQGSASTTYLHFGERVRIEVLDTQANNVFGTIDQQVLQNHP